MKRGPPPPPPPGKGGFKGAKGYGAINKVMKAMAMGAR